MGQSSDAKKANTSGSITSSHIHTAKIISRPSSQERINFLRDIVIAIAFSVGVFLIGYNYPIYKMPKLPTVADRVVFTLRCLCLSILPLVAGIIDTGHLHFVIMQTPRSQVATQLEETLNKHSYCLQDTFIQTFIHSIIMLSVSTLLDESAMRIVPLLLFLFLLGRVTFWAGYIVRPLARAFGFTLTVFPSILTLGYCVIRLWWKGAGWELPISK